jgi:hypothetical protein
MNKTGCQCRQCVGPNGGNKAMKKKIKHSGRQDDRQQEKEAKLLTLVKNKYEKKMD